VLYILMTDIVHKLMEAPLILNSCFCDLVICGDPKISDKLWQIRHFETWP
jgi:hypothetical protein